MTTTLSAVTAVDVALAGDRESGAWEAFVSSRADAVAYHQWRWRAVFEDAFGHETAYLLARRQGTVAGVLPLVLFRSAFFGRFAVSLPFVNYGGVLAEDDVVARALLERAEELATGRGLSHIELRHLDQHFEGLPSKRHKVAMRLDLAPDVTTAWEALDRKVRNQVRKAEKSEMAVESGGAELLPQFYGVFARNMRDLGTPVYARRFFDEVFRQFPGEARVFLVRHTSGVAAAGISYRYRETIEVPWASSLKEFRTLAPNTLLYWHLIRHAIEQGARKFDFGRSTPNEGTYRFKEQWGARPSPVCWEYRLLRGTALPDQSPKNPKFQAAIAIWKRLPLGVTTTLGPRIVRSIP
jgi:FemAB-related protein (PEP-CTERM system-associated)